MVARSHRDLQRLRRSVQRVRRWSDRMIGLGPFGIGADGALAWIPGAGFAYTVGAGGYLLWQAWRAHAPLAVIVRMGSYIVADSLTDIIPIPVVPAVADMLFTGHKWAADALLKHMDETVYYEGTRVQADADAAFRREMQALEAKGRRPQRVVYLADAGPLGGRVR